MTCKWSNSIILSIISVLIVGCNKKADDKIEIGLDYFKVYDIPVIEPSGLDLTFEEKGFWTVSDNNSTIYELDNWGKIVKSFKVEGIDLEGISVIDEQTLAVVAERGLEILIIDTAGTELNRLKVDIKGEFNSGLEGISYDPENKIFFVLNEKNPCMLLTFNEDLNEISRDTLSFIKDASGIHFDLKNNLLWILSDESQCVTKCDLAGNPIKKYKIKVAQPEGLTIDSDNKRMYIVSDVNSTLYVFNLE